MTTKQTQSDEKHEDNLTQKMVRTLPNHIPACRSDFYLSWAWHNSALTKSTTEVVDNTTQFTNPGYNVCSTVLQYKDSTIVQDTTPTAQNTSIAVVSPNTLLDATQVGV